MTPEYTKRIEVDGEVYTLQKFPARKALGILTRVLKLVGEPVSAFTSGADLDAAEVLPRAVKALAERLDQTEVISLMEEIIKGVTLGEGSVSPNFDNHFQGRIGHLFKLVLEALKFQYGDFLDALAVVRPRAPGAVSSMRGAG